MLLVGRAYGQRATLEVTSDSLIWRAHTGDAPENIATTTHDLRGARVVTQRWSIPGLLLCLLAGMWMASESVAIGTIPMAVGATLLALRLANPNRYLLLDLGSRTLVLTISRDAAENAKQLVERVARHELPASPPTLP